MSERKRQETKSKEETESRSEVRQRNCRTSETSEKAKAKEIEKEQAEKQTEEEKENHFQRGSCRETRLMFFNRKFTHARNFEGFESLGCKKKLISFLLYTTVCAVIVVKLVKNLLGIQLCCSAPEDASVINAVDKASLCTSFSENDPGSALLKKKMMVNSLVRKLHEPNFLSIRDFSTRP